MSRGPGPSHRVADGGSDRYCCKVERTAKAYDLDGVDEILIRRREERGDSVRALATHLNTLLVDAALDGSDVSVRAAPDDVYHVVSGDADGTTGLDVERREIIKERLDLSDIDLAALESNFVSHETVRKHLRDHLDVKTSRVSEPASIDDAREMFAAIRERDASIVERKLHGLRRDGRIDSGPVDVAVTVSVTCEACGRTSSVDEFLDGGTCECGGRTDDSDRPE